jgi:RNA polymerase sigma-70 factor (ECF subfamily)
MVMRLAQNGNDERDVKLLQRVATKDKVAFEELYRQYYRQLSRYLSRLLRRPEMVEEVVNDTLFVVWEKASQFQGRSKVSTWITGIAYLKGIKALDRVKKMPEQNSNSLLALEQIEEEDNLITKLGLQEWLRDGLDRISPEQRSVVELTYYFGYSYVEISEIMACPVNTVKTRMFHARRKLGNLLSQSGEHNYGNVDESEGRVVKGDQLPSEGDINSDVSGEP